MIDTRNETLLTLSRAAKDVPGHPHLSTLVRWATRGVKSVRLETILIGGRRFTSREAIQRFIARLSEPQGPPAQPGHQRAQRLLRVENLLAADGL
jgi:hypothetical protein